MQEFSLNCVNYKKKTRIYIWKVTDVITDVKICISTSIYPYNNLIYS